MDSRDISKPQPGIQQNQQILEPGLSSNTPKDQLKGQNQRLVNQPSAYARMPNKDVCHSELPIEISHQINPRNVIDLEEVDECEPEIADPEKAIPLGCARNMNAQENMQKQQQQGQIVNYQQPINHTQTQICKASTFIDLCDDRIQQQQILNQQNTLKAQHEPIRNDIPAQVPIQNSGQIQAQPLTQQRANPIQVMAHEQTITITTTVINPTISNESILPQTHQTQIERVNNFEQTMIASDQVDQNRSPALDEHVQIYDQLNQTPVFQQSRFHTEDNQHNQNLNILQRTAHTVQQNVFSPDEQFLRSVVSPSPSQFNQNTNQITNTIQQNSINIPILSRLQTTHQSQQIGPVQRQQTQNLTVSNNEQAQVITSLNSAIQFIQNVSQNPQIHPQRTQMDQQLCVESMKNNQKCQNKNQNNEMREKQGMQMEEQRQVQLEVLDSNILKERQPVLQPGQITQNQKQKQTEKEPVISNQKAQIIHQNENKINEKNQIILQPQPAQGEPCMFGQSPQLTDINQIRNMLLTNLPPHLQQLTLTLDDKQLRQMYLDIRAQQTRLAQQQQQEGQKLNKKQMSQQSNLIDVDNDIVIQNNYSQKPDQKPKKQATKPSQSKKSVRTPQQQQSKANHLDDPQNASSPSPNSQSHSQTQAAPKPKISSKHQRKRVVTTIVQQIEYLDDSDSHNERPSKCVVLDNGQVKRKKNHSNRSQMQAILGQLCTLVKSLDLAVLNGGNSSKNGNNTGNGDNQNYKQKQ